MAAIYEDAHLLAAATAVTNLGNRIGLFATNTKVGGAGVAVADTTWAAATKVNDGGVDYGQREGSTVTITIPPGTVANGTTINRYGIFNGTTLLRKVDLPISLVVNDGSQEVKMDVKPIYRYRPADS